LSNPGFETPPIGDWNNGPHGAWILSVSSSWKTSGGSNTGTGTGTGVWTNAARSGGSGFRGTTQLNTGTTLTLTQQVVIPVGVSVNVNAWVKSLRSTNPNFQFKLTLDTTQIGPVYTPTPADNLAWKQLGSTAPAFVVGAATNNIHTLRLDVTTQAQGNGNVNIFNADDFAITPVSGPGGLPLCPQPV
jgi:hypothetical protein